MKQIFVELCSICNFDCEFCPYQMTTRKKEYLDIRNLEIILDSLKEIEDIEYIMFSALGEPMIHPEFVDACVLVKKYGYNLKVTTNGSLLSDDHRKIQIDEIYISLHSLSEDEFRHRRCKYLSYENYLETIKYYLHGDHPKAILYILGTGFYDYLSQNKGLFDIQLDLDNKGEALKIINKWCKYFEANFKEINDINRIFLNDRYIYLRKNLYIYCSLLYNWGNTILPPGYKVKNACEIIPNDCDYFNDQIVILTDGSVSFCCLDYDGIMTLGNILNENMGNILMKKQSINDLSKFEICRKCKGKIINE